MPKSVSFTDPYAQDYAELARKQKLAEILGQQAIEPAGNTEIVSGWAVPQGPLQGFSKVAQAGLSAYMMNKTGERERLLAEKVREGGKKDAADFITALQGTPAQPSTYEADTFDEADKQQLAMDMGTPAVAGDKNKALAIALGAGNPMVQQAGASLMANMLKDPTEKFGKIMPHSFTPDSLATYQQSGNYADLKPIAGGRDFGKVNPGQFTPESLARYAESGQWGDLVPFRAPVQIDQGDRKTVLDPGTGDTREFSVGLKPGEQPAVQAAQTVAKETAKAGVEAQANSEKNVRSAASELPVIEDKANYALNLLDTMVGSEDGKVKPHRGFDNYIGTWTGEYQAKIPSSQAADFKAYHDQVKGTAFLEAFESLKGGGQITQVEGDKATAAITRMERAQSRGEYTTAARELQGIIKQGLKRARDKAKQPSGRPPIDDLWGKP